MGKLKTRFAPSPTGYLHVGGARTALFNFLAARQAGGTFLLRIEDTDRARHDESAVGKIIDDLRWLGIAWDEGVEVGGQAGPYRQSQRLETYRDCVDRLLTEGKAYCAFETPEDLDAMRKATEADKKGFRYPRPDPLPSAEEAESARAQGRPVVVRFLCPGADVTVSDDVFGQVTTPADQTDDFVILKADGWPTYHFANVVDDELMGVTLIMRGQEFLGQTWRQKLLREALGFAEPAYAHLPLILDMAGRKLSKRDGDVEVHAFRAAGYLPETLVNFIALLGWSPPGDREKFTINELAEAFSIDRVSKANAKFDRDKLLAFNTDAVAAAGPDRLLAALRDYLALNDTPIPADNEKLAHLIRANPTLRTFADVVAKSAVLFVADDEFDYDPKAVKKVLSAGGGAGYAMLERVRPALVECDWTAQAVKAAIEAVAADSSVGMGKVAQPLRVAVCGTAVSPPIHDTLLILGKPKTLARIDRCLGRRAHDKKQD